MELMEQIREKVKGKLNNFYHSAQNGSTYNIRDTAYRLGLEVLNMRRADFPDLYEEFEPRYRALENLLRRNRRYVILFMILVLNPYNMGSIALERLISN